MMLPSGTNDLDLIKIDTDNLFDNDLLKVFSNNLKYLN